MIKPISDISGATPAVSVQIVADGKTVLSLDMTQVEVATLVQDIMGKMKVADVSAVMKPVVATPVTPAPSVVTP